MQIEQTGASGCQRQPSSLLRQQQCRSQDSDDGEPVAVKLKLGYFRSHACDNKAGLPPTWNDQGSFAEDAPFGSDMHLGKNP